MFKCAFWKDCSGCRVWNSLQEWQNRSRDISYAWLIIVKARDRIRMDQGGGGDEEKERDSSEINE